MRDSPTDKVVRPRVWRACETCRKRKIRCDGQEPCGFCGTNDKTCIFTAAQDHASRARQIDSNTQSRLERLESQLGRLLPLVETTHAWMAESRVAGGSNTAPTTAASSTAPAASSSSTVAAPASPSLTAAAAVEDEPVSAAADTLASFSEADYATDAFQATDAPDVAASEAAGEDDADDDAGDDDDDDSDERSGEADAPAAESPPRSWADRLAGQLARDSNGGMRYLGGAPTFVLTEAIEAVRQARPTTAPSANDSVDQLYFRPNVFYRPLTGLPSPESLVFPPLIISDALVQMYFSKIHHTFPIVDAVPFLQNYAALVDGLRRGQRSSDHRFLCILFAVYASAASLTKKVFQDRDELEFSDPKEYVGLEFYEKALYMYWSGFRMNSIDHVTCMAILASCLAGWNTLAQAWVICGIAVRHAQDLGLHRSSKNTNMSEEALEYRRRVWWCVYGLDKILSVSLGRPSAINDEDCDVEYPSDKTGCGLPNSNDVPGNNPITGFQSLLRIYSIAGEIERTAHNITFLRNYDNVADHPVVRSTIGELNAKLEGWSDSLPDSIRFAANNPARPDMFSMCLLGHFTLYACILNLHRPFMPDLNNSNPTHTYRSLQRCVDAAQGCINVGEEVKKLLPTSHHCQFCVQYLTISGVTLLRALPYVTNVDELIQDATRCRMLLVQLEDTWPGSKRCGALIQDLLDVYKQKGGRRRKRARSSTSSAPSKRPHMAAPARPQPSQPAARDETAHAAAQPAQAPMLAPAHAPTPTVAVTPNTQAVLDLCSAEWATAGEGARADAGGLDLSHIAAPFDLDDEIGVLLAQMQTSTGSLDAAWPTWT